jgi:hypothetical protein
MPGALEQGLGGAVAKHAVAPSRRLAQLKVAGAVVLVVAFVVLFVGGATGMIGSSDDDSNDPGAASGPSSGAPSNGASPGDVLDPPTATDDPTEIVTDVPPQEVKDATKLKRSLAWLRRGLADETTFRVGTFNVLGDSHTRQGGNKRGWASSYTRMGWAYSLIQQAELDVVGFQEFEGPQYSRFMSLGGGAWDVYPGPTLDRGSIRDSIAWRTDVWELVEADDIAIPYFGGQLIRRPVVKLKNLESEREVWFFNVHNPADTPNHGNNSRWRGNAVSMEIELANELSADGTPVVFTGDYNDRAEVFCPMTGGTDLEAANGGSGDDGCSPPAQMDVDWIFGSSIEWADFVSASQGIVGKVSDHPFVYAEAYIPQEPLAGQPGDQPGDEPGNQPTGSPSPSADASETPDAG